MTNKQLSDLVLFLEMKMAASANLSEEYYDEYGHDDDEKYQHAAAQAGKFLAFKEVLEWLTAVPFKD